MTKQEILQKHKQYLFPSVFNYYAEPLVTEHAKMQYLWDIDGKQYLDFSGSAAVNFIGHGVREISDAMVEQARALEFAHTSQFTTPIAEEYARVPAENLYVQ